MKGGTKHKKMTKKAVRGNLVLFGTQGQQQEDEYMEEEGDGEEEETKQKDRKKRKRVEYSEYWWRLLRGNYLRLLGYSSDAISKSSLLAENNMRLF